MPDILNLRKLMDIENLHENPHGTKQGQLPMSVMETFWARIAREGRAKSVTSNSKVLPIGSVYTGETLNPSPDCLFYPKFASVTSTVDAELMIQIASGIPQMQSMYPFRGFVKAGNPVYLTFDGDTVISSIGTMSFAGINAGSVEGRLIGTIYGYEVNFNA
ncbi:hypothetical protein [Peribacillus frigoritolerans]|uniref:hypothetical protein n=1 Tax=Peribacillus frigoritolerans TaxID=450367 RepID=UPI002EC4BCEF|nr:hypothetical protein [Peribacillus frigoritolerans]